MDRHLRARRWVLVDQRLAATEEAVHLREGAVVAALPLRVAAVVEDQGRRQDRAVWHLEAKEAEHCPAQVAEEEACWP